MTTSVSTVIAGELGARQEQVDAAVRLLDGGATVPFIARYRKEATGGLDDAQLRRLEERLIYLRELDQRRTAILASIEEQGRLTPELRAKILAADTKTRLEDLYLPYKKKRRTKAMIAREAGLEPLADAVLADSTTDPLQRAADYLAPELGFGDAEAALEGARQILMERFAEDADLVGELREHVWRRAELRATVDPARRDDPGAARFADYFEHREPLAAAPSHRILALLRGRREGVLRLEVWVDGAEGEDAKASPTCEHRIARHFGIEDRGRAADAWLRATVRKAWRVKISTHIELELVARLRETAEQEAITVFANNLQDLLLAAAAGPRTTIGLDPGLRTGVKVAIVDGTGKVVATDTVYPHAPHHRRDAAIARLAQLAATHHAGLVAIGNGTASRETDRMVAELIHRHPELGLSKIVVSEAGASVYSASELASGELPDLDVSLRGAVSIARRLQDPLAELVKIEPKSIGVGQYQHDVNQTRLARQLDAVVEDCVNRVGVDLNTASVPLLARVSGLNGTLARNLVAQRDARGAFRSRQQLLDVPRLGPKAFEQAAGFLRIRDGDNPLDASGVHPEAYPVVARILSRCGTDLHGVLGKPDRLRALDPAELADDRFGLPTVADILAELEKPGRDPRPEFATATFLEGVETLADLRPGMVLEGVVTNVAGFGAFVDVGVHQDGLVHVSCLSNDYVEDPRTVVKAGQVVKVKVLGVEPDRQRIALSMRLSDEPGERGRPVRSKPPRGQRERGHREPPAPPNALARALERWKNERG